MIGNIQSAGTAITLTASSNVVFTELAWRPGDHLQAEDRCHRIGQKRTVWAHYLIAKGTIEEALCGIIQRKQETITAILDGKQGDGDFDIMDKLLESIQKV